jgi:hypothetical protein
VDALAPMRNRKTLDGFAFSVMLSKGGAGLFELTKA